VDPFHVYLSPYIAVCVFFIISGFYMSLVLNETYNRPSGTWNFYLNRIFRIYPTYLVVLFCFASVFTRFIHFDHSLTGYLWWLLQQIFIFPYVIHNTLTFKTDANFLILVQMLTVGLELMFYAVAPFLVTRSIKALVILFLLCVGFYFSPIFFGFSLRLQYEYFPCILMFFMLGALSYRLYKIVKPLKFNLRWVWFLLPFFISYYLYFYHVLCSDQWSNSAVILCFYVFVAIAIPFLFKASKDSKPDRFIGDLSYPFYVIHCPMIWIFGDFPYGAWCVWGSTFALSLMVVFLIEHPVDSFRHNFFVNKTKKIDPFKPLICVFLAVGILLASFQALFMVNPKYKLRLLNDNMPKDYISLINSSDKGKGVDKAAIAPYLQYFQLISEFMPKQPEGYALQGYCYYQFGKTAKAISYYQKAIDLAPNIIWYYLNVASIYYNQGQYEQAITYLDHIQNCDVKQNLVFLISSRIYNPIRITFMDQYGQSMPQQVISGYMAAQKIQILCHFQLKHYAQVLELCENALKDGSQEKDFLNYYAILSLQALKLNQTPVPQDQQLQLPLQIF